MRVSEVRSALSQFRWCRGRRKCVKRDGVPGSRTVIKSINAFSCQEKGRNGQVIYLAHMITLDDVIHGKEA